MNSEQKNPKVEFLINVAYWIVIIAIVFVVFKYLLNKLMPIFLALVFAAVCRPLAKWLSKETHKIRLHRNIAGILSVVVLYLIFAGVIVLISVKAVDIITSAIEAAPRVYEQNVVPAFTNLYRKVLTITNRIDSDAMDTLEASFPNVLSSLGSTISNVSAKIISWITSFASNMPSILLNTIICLIATVFFAIDFDSIRTFFHNNLKSKTYSMYVNIRNSFLDMIWQFLRSYSLIFCITVAEITLGLIIVGIKHPLLIAILIGIFDAFPIVGSGMILLPWSIITLLLGQTGRGIGLLIVYAVVVIARQVIEPKIVGKRVGLRPIVTLICMYAGTKIIGGLGLFAVPIAMAIVVDLNDRGILHLFKRNSSLEDIQHDN